MANIRKYEILRRNGRTCQAPQHSQLPHVRHDIGKWTLKQLLFCYSSHKSSIVEVMGNVSQQRVQPDNLVLHRLQRLRLIRAANEKGLCVAQDAGHMPDQIFRRSRPVSRAEIPRTRRERRAELSGYGKQSPPGSGANIARLIAVAWDDMPQYSRDDPAFALLEQAFRRVEAISPQEQDALASQIRVTEFRILR